MAKVSVIVLAHNQLRFTKRCVPSILATDSDIELVVVDNGSTDGTDEYFESLVGEYGTRRCLHIRNDDNPGLCRSRNMAASVASGEFLVFFDNDAYAADRTWLSRLLGAMNADCRRAAAGPLLLYPPRGEVIQSAGGGATPDGHFGLLGRGRPVDDPRFATARSVSWVPTACMVCRHDVFREAGGFDESFDPVSIGEDIDFCLCLRSRGYDVWWEPAAKIYHFENVTTNTSNTRHLKRESFVQNGRVLRSRWLDEIRNGPLSTAEDIRYIYVRKDYADLDRPQQSFFPDRLGSIADPDDGQ